MPLMLHDAAMLLDDELEQAIDAMVSAVAPAAATSFKIWFMGFLADNR